MCTMHAIATRRESDTGLGYRVNHQINILYPSIAADTRKTTISLLCFITG
jgi:hypothetical protein